MSRALRNLGKGALRKVFEWSQRLGFDVLPRHFYSEIPSIRELAASTEWREPYSMEGVDGAEIASQLAFVRECCSPELIREIQSRRIHAEASERNGEPGFGPVEADFLFAFVAREKPPQIFQIGCGVSTAVCLAAAEYVGYSPEILCLEPYPTDFLLREAEEGRLKVIRKKAQELELETIRELDPKVFFFVDSTHTLGPAGEVSRIVLEMLPRLREGAWVHFHDIKFPYDYDRKILDSALFFQHESVLLHAFLVNNDRFRLLASLSMLHYACPDELAESLPGYRPAKNEAGLHRGDGHFPSSAFLRVVR